MSPKHVSRLIETARQFVKLKYLTTQDFMVLHTLTFVLRERGAWETQVPYHIIARESGVGRNAVVNAIKKFQMFGLIAKQKQRIKVWWGRNRAEAASRQAANLYVFPRLDTELGVPTTDRELDILTARAERRARQAFDETHLGKWFKGFYADNGWQMPPV